MSEEHDKIREAFLGAPALKRLYDGDWSNRILADAIADGLIDALKKFDEIALINRKRHL